MILSELLLHYIECGERSYRDLGKKIGINYSTLHRFTHGQVVESSALGKIIAWSLKIDAKQKRGK